MIRGCARNFDHVEHPPKRAGTRLRNLSVHAVAFVDEGANLRTFAEIRKSKGLPPMADEAGAAAGGTMPAAAQKTLVAELSKAAEGILSLLDFLKAAPVSEDPAAVVPVEVTEQMEQIGMQVAALGDQFEPPALMAPAAAGDVANAAPPAPVVMSIEEAATVKSYGRGLALKMFASFKARMASPTIVKAKVKLTFEQHASLQSKLMASLMGMMKEVAPLMSGMDEADVSAALAGPGAEAGPPVDDAAAKALADAAAAKALEEEAAKSAAVAKSKAQDEAITKLRAEVDRIGKSRGTSNAEGLGGGPPPATVTEDTTPVHGRNFSAEYAAKQKAKQSGATPNAGAAQ